MALTINQDKKVVYVAPPKKLDDKQREMLDSAPVNKKLIKRATSRKYKVI